MALANIFAMDPLPSQSVRQEAKLSRAMTLSNCQPPRDRQGDFQGRSSQAAVQRT